MSKPVIAVLVHAADARAYVSAGAADGFAIRHHADARELLATLDDPNVVLVVMDAADASGRSMAGTVEFIRKNFPTLPLLAYCALASSGSGAVVDVVRAGASGLVIRGVDDSRHAMRSAIQSAQQGSVVHRIVSLVSPHLPPVAAPLLRYALSRAVDDPSVADAARELGVDRKTLFNWLRPCGSVGPREFINWVRLAMAVGMLEDSRRTTEQVALAMGFASGTAFRNMLRRYADARSSDVRGAAGFVHVMTRFVDRLAPVDDTRNAPAAVSDVGGEGASRRRQA